MHGWDTEEECVEKEEMRPEDRLRALGRKTKRAMEQDSLVIS